MLTFEQLKPALHKWARYFRNNQFEHWELINEVWAMGNVQKLPHVNLASKRVKWDMIDYMRDRTVIRHKAQGTFYPSTKELDALTGESEREVPSFLAVQEQSQLDTKDYFEWLLRGFSRQCKLIITLKYRCGYNFAEIAPVIGVTPSRISELHAEILPRLGRKLIKAGEQVRVCTRPIKPSPEDASERRFYKRMYWRANKERILSRRKAINEARRTA
jgi:RNA polymerase sigma factor (sigma-70 family)